MSSPPVPTIGVNLTWLTPGVVGGSEEYTVRLLRAVAELEPADFRLRLYGRRDLFEAYPDLARDHAVRVMPRRHRGKAGRIALEHSWLPAVSAGDRVVHHAGGVVPLVRWQVPIVTVHDLQPLDLPDNFSPVKQRWLAFMLPRSVRAARFVICPSRFTAERLRRRLGVSEDRIWVVGHGHRPAMAGTGDRDRGWGSAALAAVATDPNPYVLLPAIAYRHKRHRDVVEALASLPGVSLVMTGRPGPETDLLRSQILRLGMQDRVHQLGRVSEPDLQILYRRALALVFPSEYEGFGNPALEAMGHGCPALVSDSGSLPEVVGEAGVIIPTGSVPAWRQAIVELSTRPDLARELAERGRQRAARFTPEQAGRSLVAVYRRALRLPLETAA